MLQVRVTVHNKSIPTLLPVNDALTSAQKRFAELPLDTIPEITVLPSNSRMPFNLILILSVARRI